MHRWRDWGVAPQLATLAHNVRKGKGSIETCKKVKWMLEAFIFPALGHRPIIAMRSAELLVKLKKIETKGPRSAIPLIGSCRPAP